MSHKKVLGVGVPEALGLKAEIERAISESKNASMSSSAVKPKDTAAKTNRGVRERARNDLLTHETQAQQSSSHQAQIAKTKRALEKKARIYDMLTNTTDDRNSSSSSNVLGSAHFDDPYIAKILEESSVDFACKQLERRAEKLGRQADSQTGFELSASNSDNDNASDLVEIIDEFGRSRMVPRNRKRQYHTETSSDSDSDSTDDGNGPWSPRDRGTSYYKLDTNTAKRNEQLSMLRELHEETLKAREHSSGNAANIQQRKLAERREQIRASRNRALSKLARRGNTSN